MIRKDRDSEPKARILSIIKGTTVDGPGLRTSIYFSGCRHHCPECHNPQSWDFETGELMTLSDLMAVVAEEDFDVTLSGGDPLYQPEFVAALTVAVRKAGHSTWIYTGFTLEEILADEKLICAVRDAEAIVEGRYDDSLRSPDLPFRGSSNQRIIYVTEDTFKNRGDCPGP